MTEKSEKWAQKYLSTPLSHKSPWITPPPSSSSSSLSSSSSSSKYSVLEYLKEYFEDTNEQDVLKMIERVIKRGHREDLEYIHEIISSPLPSTTSSSSLSSSFSLTPDCLVDGWVDRSSRMAFLDLSSGPLWWGPKTIGEKGGNFFFFFFSFFPLIYPSSPGKISLPAVPLYKDNRRSGAEEEEGEENVRERIKYQKGLWMEHCQVCEFSSSLPLFLLFPFFLFLTRYHPPTHYIHPHHPHTPHPHRKAPSPKQEGKISVIIV